MNRRILQISTGLRRALGVLLIAAVLLNCLNIATRYFFDFSILSADELQVFAMVAIAFLGTICVSAERQHLRMDVLRQAVGPRFRRVLDVLESLVTVAICGLMGWVSWQFVARVYRLGQRSGMADLPMWIPHATVTLAFTATALLALMRLVHLCRRDTGDDA